MLPFTYGLDGTVYSVGEAFSQLRRPSVPIPPAVTELTGLTDEMVAGHSIDPAEVARFIGARCPCHRPQRQLRPAVCRGLLRRLRDAALGLLATRCRLGGRGL
jgi:hypothetical protein